MENSSDLKNCSAYVRKIEVFQVSQIMDEKMGFQTKRWMRGHSGFVHSLALLCSAWGLLAGVQAQTTIIATGWNHDVVAENDGSPYVSQSLDYDGYSLVETGLPRPDGSPGVGLPTDHNFTSLYTGTEFTLQSYSANNALLLSNWAANGYPVSGVSKSGTLVIDSTDQSAYSSLHVLTVSSAALELNVTLYFADSTSATFNIHSTSWASDAPSGPPAHQWPNAIPAMDRVQGTTIVANQIEQWYAHETSQDLTALNFDQKIIESIDFAIIDGQGFGSTAILAISGVKVDLPIPEPSVFAAIFAGSGVLLLKRRRRR